MCNAVSFKVGAGRVSNHAKRRLVELNQRYPVGAKCRFTAIDGTDEIVTVASPFCLINGEPMGLFKEYASWVSARVRDLPPQPWKPRLYS